MSINSDKGRLTGCPAHLLPPPAARSRLVRAGAFTRQSLTRLGTGDTASHHDEVCLLAIQRVVIAMQHVLGAVVSISRWRNPRLQNAIGGPSASCHRRHAGCRHTAQPDAVADRQWCSSHRPPERTNPNDLLISFMRTPWNPCCQFSPI